MSSNKLHPIYVALDSYQYSRAVKLASALPDSNVLGKCLLAHAQYKMGLKYHSLKTLYKLLLPMVTDKSASAGNDRNSPDFLCELEREIAFSVEALEERQQAASMDPNSKNKTVIATTTSKSESSSLKKGKKGKKKSSNTSTPKNSSQAGIGKQEDSIPSSNVAGSGIGNLDLVFMLTQKPKLSQNWDVLPLTGTAITDETILATISATLTGLKLPLTAYQLYAWAAGSGAATEPILRRTFTNGLRVLAAPTKWTTQCQERIEASILSNMQTVALQWAKLYASQPGGLSTFPPSLATAWAAQTALWQLQWLPKDDKRSMILPRLSESMALRLLQNQEHALAVETHQLALRVLDEQSKWTEMVEILDEALKIYENESPSIPMSDFGVAMTKAQLLREKCRAFMELENYKGAQAIYEELLLSNPDDWSYWLGHLKCSSKCDTLSLTTALIDQVLDKRLSEKYPIRGPHLIKVELRAHIFRNQPTDENLQLLSTSIQEYSQIFASRAVCTYSDIEKSLDLLASSDLSQSETVFSSLLEFALKLRENNTSLPLDSDSTIKTRQSRLRAFIFGVKMNHKILEKNPSLWKKWIPDSAVLISEWKASMSMDSINDGEETQKEVKPGDDLVLLAVQQLLCQNRNNASIQMTCAALLEAAMRYSPDNAYLKMMAIQVFYELDSVSRSWEIFEGMGIKHIQLDSCTFPIIPYLQRGGLYNEAVQVCNTLLRFQASSANDCGDYAGRAMEKGTMGKADEFLVFQRQKINNSLSVLDAKGLILDCAPLLATPVQRKRVDEDVLFKGCLGHAQGIVGGDNDFARAAQMVVESHNPYAALSLIPWAGGGGSIADCKAMSDNRDESIFSQQILHKAKLVDQDTIAKSALRRGHVHGVLIHGSLCLDAAKGPKKGKIVKNTEQLEKRTEHFLNSVNGTKYMLEEYILENEVEDKCAKALIAAMLDLCRIIAIVNAGLPTSDTDSLAEREERACVILLSSVVPMMTEAKNSFSKTVKSTCYFLPNYCVPLYAVFNMCGKIFDLYGWGKRKYKSKACASALRKLGEEFQDFVNVLLESLSKLPESETTDPSEEENIVGAEYIDFIGNDVVRETSATVSLARYRTRMRIQPILEEMLEHLKSFTLIED